MATNATAGAPAQHNRHLAVARPAGTARREQALRRARDARRRLEQRDQAGERFAYLRSTHD